MGVEQTALWPKCGIDTAMYHRHPNWGKDHYLIKARSFPGIGAGEHDLTLQLCSSKPMSTVMGKAHLGDSGADGAVMRRRTGAREERTVGRRRSSILIVDDDAEVSRGYALSLGAGGYAVALACDGETAIDLAGEKQFDAVVADIDMDGDSKCRMLKRLREQHRDLPVVVLSRGLAFASARAAVECGAHRYLLKPVSDERLLEVLVEAIQDSSRGKG
jgi:CheY-like chemotaxis protein